MGWTVRQMSLALLMVATGSINTLASSWADNTKSEGSDGVTTYFNHPFFQAAGMFLGETMCFCAYIVLNCYKRNQKKKHPVDLEKIEHREDQVDKSIKWKNTPLRFNPFMFLPPALCDMIGTSLMYVGLIMTYPSSYQMLRGSLIIFTGLLSVAFLGRTLKAYQWVGMLVVLVGLVITGLADFLGGDSDMDMSSVITGDLLIIIAQVVAASQMVIEEKVVVGRDVNPLAAVGCEGIFGFVIMSILLVPMYYIHVSGSFSTSPEHRLDDAIDAFVQMGNSWQICLAMVGSVISIAFFNFAGISVTKEISATTRTVIDSIRTLIVWVVSLGVGWEEFMYLQVVGYVVLVIGMFIYNDIIFLPYMRDKGWIKWKSCYPPLPAAERKSSDSREELNVNDGDSVLGADNSSIRGLDNPVAHREGSEKHDSD